VRNVGASPWGNSILDTACRSTSGSTAPANWEYVIFGSPMNQQTQVQVVAAIYGKEFGPFKGKPAMRPDARDVRNVNCPQIPIPSEMKKD
jgi:hypothetical protein